MSKPEDFTPKQLGEYIIGMLEPSCPNDPDEHFKNFRILPCSSDNVQIYITTKEGQVFVIDIAEVKQEPSER